MTYALSIEDYFSHLGWEHVLSCISSIRAYLDLPVWPDNLVEIDHEIFSMVILSLQLNGSCQFKKGSCQFQVKELHNTD